MQLPAPVLAEVVPRTPVLLVVLVRDQRVEHLQHLPAHVRDRVEGDNEDEVVSPDVPDEAALRQDPLHHIVQDARQDVDDAIAVVVAVAVVVLLEVVEIGVAHGEQLAVLHPASDLALDLGRPGQARGRIDRDVARRARHQAVEAARLLGPLEQRADHLVRPRREPFLHALGRVAAGEHRQGDDRRIRVPLEPGAEREALRAAVGVDHHELRQRAQHLEFDLGRVRHGDDRQPLTVDPAPQEVRYRATSRREKQYRGARPAHRAPRVRVERA